jgi:hypothetical protein
VWLKFRTTRHSTHFSLLLYFPRISVVDEEQAVVVVVAGAEEEVAVVA